MILKVGNIAGDLISRPCPREKEGSGMLELSITQNFSDNVNTMKAHNSGIEQTLCILTTSRTACIFITVHITYGSYTRSQAPP